MNIDDPNTFEGRAVKKMENLPSRESIDRGHRYYCNNDFPWAKLKNWANRQVGRHVNDAFHDYTKMTDVPHRLRNREFFNNLISTNTHLIDGKVYVQNYEMMPIDNMWYWQEVYMHPATGIIHKRERRRRQKLTPEVWRRLHDDFRKVGKYQYLIRENGIWFMLDLNEQYTISKSKPEYDSAGKWAGWKQWEEIVQTPLKLKRDDIHRYPRQMIKSKHQLCTKLLRKYNIANEHQ